MMRKYYVTFVLAVFFSLFTLSTMAKSADTVVISKAWDFKDAVYASDGYGDWITLEAPDSPFTLNFYTFGVFVLDHDYGVSEMIYEYNLDNPISVGLIPDNEFFKTNIVAQMGTSARYVVVASDYVRFQMKYYPTKLRIRAHSKDGLTLVETFARLEKHNRLHDYIDDKILPDPIR